MRFGALALVLVLVAPPLTAEAQPVEKVPRVAYLSVESAEDDKSRVAAFRQGLRELGYVEGENIIVEYRAALPRERMLAVAADFARLKVDVLVVRGWHDDLKKVTIPIVVPVHADPVGVGLVASLARPGGNVTGLSDLHGATVSKRLELLKEVRPLASRVAVLWSPLSPIALPQLKSLQAAAPALGMTTLSLEVRRAEDIDRAFRVIGNERPEALLVIAEPIVATHRRRVAELAIKHRLATIGTTRRFTDAGFLMAYGANFEDLWRRAATYVDKILKGANPGDLPIEQASKWDLVINLKTAKAIGITIPASLILRADLLIE